MVIGDDWNLLRDIVEIDAFDYDGVVLKKEKIALWKTAPHFWGGELGDREAEGDAEKRVQ